MAQTEDYGQMSAIRPILIVEDDDASRHAGRGVSHQMLLDAAWRHKAFGTTPTLESHIYKLRQKLETHPKGPPLAYH
jgi:hypothetical protein